MRLIHAVRDLPRDRTRIKTQSPCTPTSTGPPPSSAKRTSPTTSGPASARPYLDLGVLDAHSRVRHRRGVGRRGCVAEDPAFADLCHKLGVTFIGPGAEAMRSSRDKVGAKLIAEEVGVPVAPSSRGAVADLGAAVRAAGEIGYR